MSKVKRDFLGLASLDDYGSIIFLTIYFQNPKNRGKDSKDQDFGLEQIHYRYALQENFKFPKKWVKKEREVIDFFGDGLDILYKQKEIVKNSIKQGNTLSIILRKLKFDYGILEREEKGNSFRYSISKEYHGKTIAKFVKNELDIFKGNEIHQNFFSPEHIKIENPELPYDTLIHLVTFGISDNFIKSLDKEEKKEFMNTIIEIYHNVAILSNFKYQKTGKKDFLGIYVNSKIADKKSQDKIEKVMKNKK